MKITKLKRGCRINLTDVEFAVLEQLVDRGSATLEGEDLAAHPLSPAERRAYDRCFASHYWSVPDEDRRPT